MHYKKTLQYFKNGSLWPPCTLAAVVAAWACPSPQRPPFGRSGVDTLSADRDDWRRSGCDDPSWQPVHANGRSFLWRRRCRVSSSERENVIVQPGTGQQLSGLSPVGVCINSRLHNHTASGSHSSSWIKQPKIRELLLTKVGHGPFYLLSVVNCQLLF